MRHLVLAIGLLCLAGCVTVQSPGREQESSSLPPEETATGELAITPEPFIDPLIPIAMTGSTTVEERTLSGGILEIGNPHARVVVTIFLHPESPYARTFQQLRTPRLLPFMHSGDLAVRFFILDIRKYAGSAQSARTIACAGREMQGYPTLTLLHRNGRATLTAADVTELGLTPETFASCMKEQGDDPLQASRDEAALSGVTLVPTYIIDGTAFVGLPTEADFLGAIRAAL